MADFREFTNAFEGNGSTRILINMNKIISIWEMKNEKDEMVTCLFGEGQTWSVKEPFDHVLGEVDGTNDLKRFGFFTGGEIIDLSPEQEDGKESV